MNEFLEEQLVDFKQNILNDLISGFLDEFAITQAPIEVSFRALLPELKTERFSHLIHTYPAKLLLHIPYFFLNNQIFSKEGDTILDPFCGTGTVLLEALIAGRNSVGADANPLARLIADVKVKCYDTTLLRDQLNIIQYANRNDVDFDQIPEVVNINYWFSQPVQKQLTHIKILITQIEDIQVKDFFLVCFSNLIKKVSYADPRVSVPVRLNENRYNENTLAFNKTKRRLKELDEINVIEKFGNIVNENILRVESLNKFLAGGKTKRTARVISKDARKITCSIDSAEKIGNDSIDLIITSPPYAGAQKYIRSSSLNIGWLGMASVADLKLLDKSSIGRESFSRSNDEIPKTNILLADQLIENIKSRNIVRAKIVANYLIEMQSALIESIRVLKPNGYLILIVGNNKVCDFEFNTQQYFTDFIESKGLKLVLKLIDDIKSYGLMTKRNKTADIISREWVLIFKNSND